MIKLLQSIRKSGLLSLRAGKIYLGNKEIIVNGIPGSPSFPISLRNLAEELYRRKFFFTENKVISEEGDLCIAPDQIIRYQELPKQNRGVETDTYIIKKYDKMDEVYEMIQDTALLEIDLLKNDTWVELELPKNATSLNILDFARKIVLPGLKGKVKLTLHIVTSSGSEEDLDTEIDNIFSYSNDGNLDNMELVILQQQKGERICIQCLENGTIQVFPQDNNITNCYIGKCQIQLSRDQ